MKSDAEESRDAISDRLTGRSQSAPAVVPDAEAKEVSKTVLETSFDDAAASSSSPSATDASVPPTGDGSDAQRPRPIQRPLPMLDRATDEDEGEAMVIEEHPELHNTISTLKRRALKCGSEFDEEEKRQKYVVLKRHANPAVIHREENLKRQRRMQRFGTSAADDTEQRRAESDVIVRSPEYRNSIADPSPSSVVREDTIYVYGVDRYISKSDIFEAFSSLAVPSYVEWINGTSCNLIFESAECAHNVLEQLPVYQRENSKDTTSPSPSGVEEEKEKEEEEENEKEKEEEEEKEKEKEEEEEKEEEKEEEEKEEKEKEEKEEETNTSSTIYKQHIVCIKRARYVFRVRMATNEDVKPLISQEEQNRRKREGYYGGRRRRSHPSASRHHRRDGRHRRRRDSGGDGIERHSTRSIHQNGRQRGEKRQRRPREEPNGRGSISTDGLEGYLMKNKKAKGVADGESIVDESKASMNSEDGSKDVVEDLL